MDKKPEQVLKDYPLADLRVMADTLWYMWNEYDEPEAVKAFAIIELEIENRTARVCDELISCVSEDL